MTSTKINSEVTKKKAVIISGANGYFGSIACTYFQSQGWQVLKAIRQNSSGILLDLDRPEEFAKQKIDSQVDLFIHAAAAHEVTCREHPYRSIFHNTIGTKAILDFCVSNRIKNFVYLSTFHVFGHPTGKIDELTLPLPANDYGLSHLQAEEYVQMYTRENKISGMIIRPSNFFGIPESLNKFKRWTLTPLAFCREAVEQKKIVLKTPGFQMRNFISVFDICAALNSVIAHIEDIPLLHIPGPDDFSIRELAQLVQKVMHTHFAQEIELVIPEGERLAQGFVYQSCYLSDFYQPKQRLEDFIIDFCHQLRYASDNSFKKHAKAQRG